VVRADNVPTTKDLRAIAKLTTDAVLTSAAHVVVVSACTCGEREFNAAAVLCWSVCKPFVVSAQHVRCSHSLAVQVR